MEAVDPIGKNSRICQIFSFDVLGLRQYVFFTHMKSSFSISWILLAATILAPRAVTAAQRLELKPGDHIALVGNALPDRMQHHGWLETLIVAKHSQHDLVFRNLAASGDEVGTWHRSENFGSRDEWLKTVKADVILAFYGYNESFKDDGSIDAFKLELGKFLKEAKGKDYSGKGAPRIVVFSPIANEKHIDPNMPDPAANNARLQKYAAAMAETASANGVLFVDLFGLSQKAYGKASAQKQSLTFNGFMLNEAGDKALAPEIFSALFNEVGPKGNLEKLRASINDKNVEWHARYRTVDGYNVYGGRSALAYQPKQPKFITDRNAPDPYVSNYRIMQQEMSQRDVKTANRDQRVWAVAKGSDLKVDDSNLPSVTSVASNRDDLKPFLSGEEGIKHMTVPKGVKVQLFASEKEFPDLISPVQMAFDTKGRLWVASWPSYPERRPTDVVTDKLLIFEDTNGDGKADKMTTFLDGLNCPTGFQFYKDGVLVVQAPDLWFVRDTNGDGKADWKERVLMGLDSADSHHTSNALVLDPGGATYLSDGVFHRTQVETATGPVRQTDGCIYRFEPVTSKFERYVPYGFANPHGKVFDYWGNDIITDATGNENFFAPAFSGFLPDSIRHHGRMQQFWARPSRPCAGTAILSSRHFPEEFNGNFLNCNVIGFQGIFRVKVTEEGSGLKGETLEDLVKSDDPNFRPSSVDVAPDGSVYFLDWAKPLIGHMQHHIRDPNRDKQHGRIYRLTYEGRPLQKTVKIYGQSIPALLDALKEPENNVRTRAKIELGNRDSTKVMAAVKKWTAALDSKDPAYEHQMMEALWVHQWHNVVNEDLLKRMLRSSEPRARAAATRVLCYWRDRVADPLALVKVQVNDAHPRVRLEAVRACSFFKTAKAAEVALEVLEKEADPKKPDYYIKYCLDETMKALDKYTK